MDETTDTDDRPSHGPYGELWWNDAPDKMRWETRLTEEGKAFVAAKLVEYDDWPIKLLWKVHRNFTRYILRLEDQDSINQHCRVAFAIAAIRYQPERGKFGTFAASYLRQVCQVCVEDPRTWRSARVMLDAKAAGRSKVRLVRGFLDDDEHFRPMAEEADADRKFAFDDAVVKNKVDEWLGRVSKRQAYIVRQYIVGERTLESIGNELGVSKERVRQIIKTTKEKLGYIVTPDEYQKVVGV